jgi:hypothetical protein
MSETAMEALRWCSLKGIEHFYNKLRRSETGRPGGVASGRRAGRCWVGAGSATAAMAQERMVDRKRRGGSIPPGAVRIHAGFVHRPLENERVEARDKQAKPMLSGATGWRRVHAATDSRARIEAMEPFEVPSHRRFAVEVGRVCQPRHSPGD